MRDPARTSVAATIVLACVAATAGWACDSSPAAIAPTMAQRAAGRAYDGAPPVISHDVSLSQCRTCHDDDGTEIPGIGVAPASPHGEAAMNGAMSRCRQCHVAATTDRVFVASSFIGLPQGAWRGERATPGAPPTIPHPLLLREQCLTCHAGPAARAEIRTPHPERIRCRQCHVLSG